MIVDTLKLFFPSFRTWRIQRWKRQRFWRVWSTSWRWGRRWRIGRPASYRHQPASAGRPMMKAGGPACWGSATSSAARAEPWWSLQRRVRSRLRHHLLSPRSTTDTSMKHRCTLLSVTRLCLLHIGSSSMPSHTHTSQPPTPRSCSHPSHWTSALLCGDRGPRDEPGLLVNADTV